VRREATECSPPGGGGSEVLLGLAANATVLSMSKETSPPQPNVELTGRRRVDALPARRRIGKQRLAGKAASRWRSG
jgi:hypothetical protein